MPGYLPKPPMSDSQQKLLEQVVDAFSVSDKQLSTVLYQMHSELAKNDTWFQSESQATDATLIKRHNSPHGTALGMAIDASGKRIRISSTSFGNSNGDKQISESSAIQVFIPPANVKNSVSDFFEFVAFCISEFINAHGLVDNDKTGSGAMLLPLGVSIGLPISTQNYQPSAQGACSPHTPLSCTVAEVSKEDSLDLGDRDVARHLHDTVLRNHLPIRIASITNNVVSSLIAAQFNNSTTRVAASFNHGINAAYLKRCPDNQTKGMADTDQSQRADDGYVAVNTEIGRFGSAPASLAVLPMTMWDNRIDRESRNPGTRRFEKLVADQYLGEIVRNLITDFMDEHLLFTANCDVSKVNESYSFHTAYMAPIMEDMSADLASVGDLFAAEFGIATELADRQIIRALCDCVAARASKLSGAALAALTIKSSRSTASNQCSVALYGALFDVNHKIYNETVATMQKLIAIVSSHDDKRKAIETTVSFQPRFIDLSGAAINAASA
ncbi:hexokinase [Coemansia sp. RSA 1813]|nr:hexokinase [Coemansia sp. RSA 1646]KAJ1772388.1 hexokinase [Coemansia sp. RSA 1843]KAJ2091111.1 hexokinase [Coemansia sp. RSA 986]KAJ2212119.1 hexokinase [Coemansia sp. RSA 487]KAJ2571167.1 hexokinase [Coemansia sp. RSA 1813]